VPLLRSRRAKLIPTLHRDEELGRGSSYRLSSGPFVGFMQNWWESSETFGSSERKSQHRAYYSGCAVHTMTQKGLQWWSKCAKLRRPLPCGFIGCYNTRKSWQQMHETGERLILDAYRIDELSVYWEAATKVDADLIVIVVQAIFINVHVHTPFFTTSNVCGQRHRRNKCVGLQHTDPNDRRVNVSFEHRYQYQMF